MLHELVVPNQGGLRPLTKATQRQRNPPADKTSPQSHDLCWMNVGPEPSSHADKEPQLGEASPLAQHLQEHLCQTKNQVLGWRLDLVLWLHCRTVFCSRFQKSAHLAQLQRCTLPRTCAQSGQEKNLCLVPWVFVRGLLCADGLGRGTRGGKGWERPAFGCPASVSITATPLVPISCFGLLQKKLF